MATVKDIAEAVGVSTGTVDRIIHSRGRYSEETAEKVRQAMKDLNYTPNIHARGLKKSKKHRFGVLMPLGAQDSGYWNLVENGIGRAAQELVSYGGEVQYFFYDTYSAESCLEVGGKAIAAGIEGLLIAPTRPEEIRSLLMDVNIPFIFIDSDIPELKSRASYIGQDSRQSGILSGKLMGLLLNGKLCKNPALSVLVVDPPVSNYHLRSRIEGFRSYMETHLPSVRLIRIKEETDDEEMFHAFLEEYLREEENIPDGIFVANSSVYHMASFLEKKGGIFPRIPLIGYDLIPGRESAVENGTIDFILSQQPEIQGYRGLMLLYENIVLNKEIDKEIITPLNIITKENFFTFINERTD